MEEVISTHFIWVNCSVLKFPLLFLFQEGNEFGSRLIGLSSWQYIDELFAYAKGYLAHRSWAQRWRKPWKKNRDGQLPESSLKIIPPNSTLVYNTEVPDCILVI